MKYDINVSWNQCPICGKFIIKGMKTCVTCRIKQETEKNNGIVIPKKKEKKKRGRPKKQK